MRVDALASSHVHDETLDLFLSRGAAEAELREILGVSTAAAFKTRFTVVKSLHH